MFVYKNLTRSYMRKSCKFVCFSEVRAHHFCFVFCWVFFSTVKERESGLHLIILWPQVAYTSPCLLATECYQNCLAESCLLHVDGHCKSSCRVVFHVKTISSTAKHRHMSFPPLLPVLCRLYSRSLPCDQFASLMMSVCVCACMHMRVCMCSQCHIVMRGRGSTLPSLKILLFS